MLPMLNVNGEVRIQYVKKQYSKKQYESSMSTGYVLLHDLGQQVVLGFRRPRFPDEELLPQGVFPVLNDEELRKCLDHLEPEVRGM